MAFKLSPEEQKGILRYIVSNSPVNEVDKVVNDLKKILGSDYNKENCSKFVCNFYETNHTFLSGKDQSVILGEHCKLSPNEYYNPKNDSTFKVDYLESKIVGSSKGGFKTDPQVESYRKAIESALINYTEENYIKNKYETSVFGSKNGLITIVNSALNSNLKNYWSGSWMCKYSLNVFDKTDLTCEIKVDTHYFEDGNIKFETIKSNEKPIIHSDIDSTVKSIIGAIIESEDEIKQATKNFLDSLDNDAFKALRRFLPVTRQKMKWSVRQTLTGSLM